LTIDKSNFENPLVVRKFVIKVYSKSKVIFISIRVGILIVFSGIEIIDAIG